MSNPGLVNDCSTGARPSPSLVAGRGRRHGVRCPWFPWRGSVPTPVCRLTGMRREHQRGGDNTWRLGDISACWSSSSSRRVQPPHQAQTALRLRLSRTLSVSRRLALFRPLRGVQQHAVAFSFQPFGDQLAYLGQFSGAAGCTVREILGELMGDDPAHRPVFGLGQPWKLAAPVTVGVVGASVRSPGRGGGRPCSRADAVDVGVAEAACNAGKPLASRLLAMTTDTAVRLGRGWGDQHGAEVRHLRALRMASAMHGVVQWCPGATRSGRGLAFRASRDLTTSRESDPARIGWADPAVLAGATMGQRRTVGDPS